MRQVQRIAPAALLSVALASVALAGLALAWGEPLLAAGAGLVFVFAVALVTFLRRLKRHRQQASSAVEDFQVTGGEAADLEVAAGEVADPEPAAGEVDDPEVPGGETADIEDVTDVRVLHAQIRALEEALEQETAVVRELAFAPDTIRDEAVAEFHRRIRLTVRGLAVRMEDDPTAVDVLARVSAGVDRLMAPNVQFVRPTLTIASKVATLSIEMRPAAFQAANEIAVEEAAPEIAAPEVAVPEAAAPEMADFETAELDLTDLETAAPEMADFETAELDLTDLDTADSDTTDPEIPDAAPSLDAPPGEELVLPIPARTPSPEIRRGRHWLRRSAA